DRKGTHHGATNLRYSRNTRRVRRAEGARRHRSRDHGGEPVALEPAVVEDEVLYRSHVERVDRGTGRRTQSSRQGQLSDAARLRSRDDGAGADLEKRP